MKQGKQIEWDCDSLVIRRVGRGWRSRPIRSSLGSKSKPFFREYCKQFSLNKSVYCTCCNTACVIMGIYVTSDGNQINAGYLISLQLLSAAPQIISRGQLPWVPRVAQRLCQRVHYNAVKMFYPMQLICPAGAAGRCLRDTPFT